MFVFIEGQLKITLTGGPHETVTREEGGLSLELVEEESFGKCENYELGYYISLENYIEQNLLPSIKVASRKLQARFEKEMVFLIDPESSWMEFITEPIFNIPGDLIAGIRYKP